MAGIYSQGGSAGHRYAGWLSEVEAKNFQFGGKVFNGSPSAIYVGSNLVWMGLTEAAEQAILAAFGQTDGKAVINATNAYLNQLAASDRDKATALAGFINEDPMMVCSLGLQPQLTVLERMPVRWLYGDGNARIDTGALWNVTGDVYKMLVYNMKANFIRPASGNQGYDGSYYRGHRFLSYSSVVNGRSGYLEAYYDNLFLDGTSIKSGGDSGNTYGGNVIIARAVTKFASFEIASTTEERTRMMYPFIRKIDGVAKFGMIDILHDVFYQNANSSGTFTEQYGNIVNGVFIEWTPTP